MLQANEVNHAPPEYPLTSRLKVIRTGMEQILDAVSATGHSEIAEQVGLNMGLLEKALDKAALQELQIIDLVRELQLRAGESQMCYDILELLARIIQHDHPHAAEFCLLITHDKSAHPNSRPQIRSGSETPHRLHESSEVGV